MEKKRKLLNYIIIVCALISIIRLSGFPQVLHITLPRAALITFIIITLVGWFFLSAHPECIIKHKKRASFCFHLCIFTFLFSALLFVLEGKLIIKDGTLYLIGAFIRQSRPFLFYIMAMCLCIIVFLVFHMGQTEAAPLKILITENLVIPELLLLFIGCVLVYGAFIPLRDNYYPSHDYAIFSYFGQQILRGKMPYTDLWDHKPPVIFYLNAIGLKIANGSLAGIWVIEFLMFYLGTVIFFRLLKKFFPRWVSLSVLFFGTLHYVRLFDFGNYTEEISLFFSICALGLYFSRIKSRFPNLSGFLIGLLCGLAFTSKQNTIGCWIALFIVDFLQQYRSGKDIKHFFKFWVLAGCGFILVNVCWIIYFAANNALSAYWDVAFRFNFTYSEKSSDSRLACAVTTLTFLPSISPYLLCGFLCFPLIFIRFIRNKQTLLAKNHVLTLWAMIDLPIELFFAGLSGMNYQHYFILCILPIVILLSEMINYLSVRLSHHTKLYQFCTITILLIFSLPLTQFFQDNYMHRMPSSYTKTRDYLLVNTVPDRSILVWGSRSAIYVMSERYAPTAYFNERPLYLFPDDIQTAQWDEFLSDLIKDPPQVIVYTHDTALPFITQADSECVLPDGEEYTKAVYNYFCDNYAYKTTINPEFYDAWDIYTRK